MLFFLFGADTYRSQQKLRELTGKFLAEKDPSALNLVELSDKDLTFGRAVQEMTTAPFLAEKKMVVLKNFLTETAAAEQKSLCQFLQEKNWEFDNLIIFWEEQFATTGKKAKLPKLLSEAIKQPTAVELSKPPRQKGQPFLIYWEEFQPLSAAETISWLQTEATKRGGQIENAAAQHLQYLIGNDLFRLQNELAKLLAYAKQRPIVKKDVADLVDAVLQEEVFKFIEAIGQKNRGLASELLVKQLLAGVNELQLLSLITRNFRILIQIQDLLDRAKGEYLPPAKVATLINEHPFAVQKSYNQLRHFDLSTLQRIYQQLLLTEQKIKTSQATPEVLLGLLVTKLTSL